MQLEGSSEWVVRELLENSSKGCLGRGALRAQGRQAGVNRAFWEAVGGVFQESALITGIYFLPSVIF